MLSAVASMRAQGTVTFQNTVTTLVKYDPSVPVLGGTAVAIGSMRVGLYWGALGSLEGSLVQLGTFATIAGLPGFFTGGTRTTGVATAPGAMGTFQARAWSAAFASYEDAISMGVPGTHFAGKSTVFNSNTGGQGSPAAPPVNLAPVIPVVSVSPVPEPSVIALSVLGLGALLLFRRRK